MAFVESEAMAAGGPASEGRTVENGPRPSTESGCGTLACNHVCRLSYAVRGSIQHSTGCCSETEWIVEARLVDLRPITRALNLGVARTHLIPRFGCWPLGADHNERRQGDGCRWPGPRLLKQCRTSARDRAPRDSRDAIRYCRGSHRA
jgi:hypothetical protein